MLLLQLSNELASLITDMIAFIYLMVLYYCDAILCAKCRLIKLLSSTETVECNQPTITNGSVAPALASTVEQGETYEVSCDSGYTLSGSPNMTCQSNGTFDQTPTCQGT